MNMKQCPECKGNARFFIDDSCITCYNTGQSEDTITPETDEHMKWFNMGVRAAKLKAKEVTNMLHNQNPADEKGDKFTDSSKAVTEDNFGDPTQPKPELSDQTFEEVLNKHLLDIIAVARIEQSWVIEMQDNLIAAHNADREAYARRRVIEALQPFRDAVLDQGSHPDYHQQQLRRLEESWPTLYRLLMGVVEEGAK